MRHLVVPNAVAGINFLASIVCMCSAAAGTVGTSAVLVLPGIHCSLAVGSTTAIVDGLVATDGASDAGSATVAVSVVAGAVSAGVSTWFLSAAVLSKSLVCPVQTCPSPYVFHYTSLSSSSSIWKRFMLRAHACTFVHVGVLPFDIREVDLLLA